MRQSPGLWVCLLAGLRLAGLVAESAEAADAYQQRVRPFVNKYCVQCHNDKKARGELNLAGYLKTSDVTREFRRWSHVIEFVRDAEMPPPDARQQPTPAERNAVVRELQAMLLAEAKKYAGDPGVVPPRRLSNTEFDLSVRDLTGIDIRPTRMFPPDPAGGEGFDNTGEALSMSPSLLKKYLSAAQNVADHLVLKTDGIAFAPFPVTSYNERKKLTEQAIIDFYQRHDVKVLDYLVAAWHYRHRLAADRSVTVESWGKRRGLSGKYLALVWKTLSEAPSQAGYLKRVGELWNRVPAPQPVKRGIGFQPVKRGNLKNLPAENLPAELIALNKLVEFGRRTLCHREPQLIKSNAGNWPIGHLDFRAKTAAVRDRFDPSKLKSGHRFRFDRIAEAKSGRKSDGLSLYLRVESALGDNREDFVLIERPIFSRSGNPPRNDGERKKQAVVTLRSLLEQHAPAVAKRLGFGRHPKGDKIDPDSFVVQAPALIELPLDGDLLHQVQGKHLLVHCRLDPKHSGNSAVTIQHSSGQRPQDPSAAGTELLVHAQSPTGRALAKSADRFCFTFPNRFAYVDEKRGLAAGFHLVEGFFRDDQPLVKKVLDQRQLRELNQLWQELDFVTRSAETLIRGFVWFERSERHVLHDKRFDFLRAEDPKLVEEKMLSRFEKIYLDKMGVKLVGDTVKPLQTSEKYDVIHGFFQQIRSGLSQRREMLTKAEHHALRDVDKLAERAYGRVLSDRDRESLKGLYGRLREQGQGVEQSLRGVMTAILMSPDFCYRYAEAAPGAAVTPLSGEALASRLSYFLWSSLPDSELLASARQGRLQSDAVLIEHTRRMLKTDKITAFSREFFGQWLRYRDYLSKDPVNGQAFAGYTAELREAMFEEPQRLATYLIQHDKPITDLLTSDTTFVNGVLARHYGGSIVKQYEQSGSSAAQWQRIEGLRQAGRGGLFGMAVILTKNSRGERTSPVRRGFWTVHHLLGQHFPPPPADVPELPPNEKQAKDTIRRLMAAHTADPRCAMCHKHFDSLGLALEGFDPIGRSRTKDLAGRTIDNVARLPSGKTAKGIDGLIEYIDEHRRQDFVRTLCRKFLGYALGRSVELSDQPLLVKMETALKQNGYRFSALFETVVTSPQFKNQRGRDFVAENHRSNSKAIAASAPTREGRAVARSAKWQKPPLRQTPLPNPLGSGERRFSIR